MKTDNISEVEKQFAKSLDRHIGAAAYLLYRVIGQPKDIAQEILIGSVIDAFRKCVLDDYKKIVSSLVQNTEQEVNG